MTSDLRKKDPTKARQEILDALERTGGKRFEAAKLLGVQYRTFLRAIQSLNLWPIIERRYGRKAPLGHTST
jgi:transcriptional regulator with GAF, ATPase, and Fis domain